MALLLEAKNVKSAIAKDKADKAAAAALGLESINKYQAGKSLRAWDVEQQGSWDISIGERLKNDGVAMCLYSDQCSEKVEAEILLEEVSEYIHTLSTTRSLLITHHHTPYNTPRNIDPLCRYGIIFVRRYRPSIV